VGLFLCLILCGCITEYEATDIDEVADILVVEGIVTDDETTITLSKSFTLTGEDDTSYSYYVEYATVGVEDDNGTQWYANSEYSYNGQYTIMMGQLDPNRKYSLKIEIDEHVYCSEPSYPIRTPEIDSIFWMKRDQGQPVTIHVATQSPNNRILYYRWTYKEEWEINSEVYLEGYPFYCWDKENSSELLIGSAEKTVSGKITDIISKISASNRKLSVLYRIDVKQNAISKRAYDYFANIKKNSQLIGSIFAPVPSELRGNITCITDPGRPVIGYMDISTTTEKRRYISRSEGAYEYYNNRECKLFQSGELFDIYGYIPHDFVKYSYSDWPPFIYVRERCVDCTFIGKTQKPDDWPK